MAKSSKPMPTEKTQRIVAAATWALVAFLGVTAVTFFLDVPIFFWIVSSLLTMGVLAWAMDRKFLREMSIREEDRD